jgi:DNA-binding protein HU-beta
MQKTEFIEHVAKEAGITRTLADKVVKASLKVIEDSLRGGEKVTLTGFGTFEVRERAPRTVTSIRTKEKVTIPAGKIAAFSAGSDLKSAVTGKAEKAAPKKEAKAAPAKKAPAAKAKKK